jgi:hypothetical protein
MKKIIVSLFFISVFAIQLVMPMEKININHSFPDGNIHYSFLEKEKEDEWSSRLNELKNSMKMGSLLKRINTGNENIEEMKLTNKLLLMLIEVQVENNRLLKKFLQKVDK